MKNNKLISLLLVLTTFLSAETLVEKARNNALEPLPNTKTKLFKLIDPNDTITDRKVELGKKLYFEPRLSKSGLISCNTCHNLAMGGADGVSAAVGHKWTANPHHLNSPTVYNAVLASSQFWDGRSPHLEDQAQGPMQAGPEMASPKNLVVQRINSIPQYVEEFKMAYGSDVNIDFELITSTIGIFERVLVTPSNYDDFLNGDEDALFPEEKEGLHSFIDNGCATCHSGVALGGKMMPFPVYEKYTYANVGDFKGDKNGMVKVPTLRNITQTAPYFHNGAVWSLSEAIKEMGRTQLGKEISNEDVEKIKIFLGSLEGRKPYITYPLLPSSTDSTPKPEMN